MFLLTELVLYDVDRRWIWVHLNPMGTLYLFKDVHVNMLDLDGQDIDLGCELTNFVGIRKRSIKVGTVRCRRCDCDDLLSGCVSAII